MTELVGNLQAAWLDRMRRGQSDLLAAAMCPGLFKPEWSLQAREQIVVTNDALLYWRGVGAA